MLPHYYYSAPRYHISSHLCNAHQHQQASDGWTSDGRRADNGYRWDLGVVIGRTGEPPMDGGWFSTFVDGAGRMLLPCKRAFRRALVAVSWHAVNQAWL
jgi:hypothetical protein